MDTNVELLRQSTKLLEYFALRNGRVFDRQQASQVMFESHLNESSKPFEDWLDTVVSCSEAMELRIRRIESPLIDVLPLVRSGYPVAVLVDEEGSQNWLVLSKIQGQRLNIVELSSGKTHWIKRAEFAKRLRASNIDNTLSWLVSYPILIGDASGTPISHHDNGHEHHNLVPPLRRLMGILRPEMKDIWTVFIFSMVVGLLTLTTPIAVEALVNTVAFGQFIQPVVILAIIVFVFLAFSSALSALTIYASEIIERRLFVRVVDDLAYRLPRVDQSVNDRQSMHELVNRFLEVITLQKSVSKLLLEGVAVVMKTAIGMLVLAFYHPFLLGYDILLLCLLAFALFVLGRGGVNTAINESVAKYRVLAWLEELSKNPTAFKLNDGMEFALDEADQLSGEYLVARKQHFRIYMRQVLFLLGIYCVATTALLGIGGALVIGGELSLGQLVAAELIVILILRSFAKLGSLIASYYDLMAAVDKLGMLFDLPMETHNQLVEYGGGDAAQLSLQGVSLDVDGQPVIENLSFEVIARQSLAVIGSCQSGIQFVADLCLGLRQQSGGIILLNHIDLRDYRLDSVRMFVGVARDVDVFAGTLETNIHLHRAQVSMIDVRRVIEKTGLLPSVNGMEHGIRTQLLSGGFPLSNAQCRRLMLARAWAGNPKLIIIDRLLDGFAYDEAKQIITNMLDSREMSVLLISERPEFGDMCQHKVEMNKTGDLGETGRSEPPTDTRLD